MPAICNKTLFFSISTTKDTFSPWGHILSLGHIEMRSMRCVLLSVSSSCIWEDVLSPEGTSPMCKMKWGMQALADLPCSVFWTDAPSSMRKGSSQVKCFWCISRKFHRGLRILLPPMKRYFQSRIKLVRYASKVPFAGTLFLLKFGLYCFLVCDMQQKLAVHVTPTWSRSKTFTLDSSLTWIKLGSLWFWWGLSCKWMSDFWIFSWLLSGFSIWRMVVEIPRSET